MAVISFWRNGDKEIGQTLSMVAVSSVMALDHNYKTLVIGTDFKDHTLQECYWPTENNTNSVQSLLGIENKQNVGTISGIEGLGMVVQSGRTGTNIIGNYTKPVFKDKRLDVLLPPETTSTEKYNTICGYYPEIVKMADMDYNMVFVDVGKNMPQEIQTQVLQRSDIIVVGMKQGMTSINNFNNLKNKNPLFAGNNVMLLVGKYDGYSKYNLKNIERFFKGKNMTMGISYNTMFYEAASEGKVIDYFFRMTNLTNPTDRNTVFMQQCRFACENIIYKIKELQVR